MAPQSSRIILKLVVVLCIGSQWAGTATAQGSDEGSKAGSDKGSLGTLPDLVFQIQQILIKNDCPYQDPDGVCSPTSSDCSDVIKSGVCYLNVCKKKSDAERKTVADLMAQIANSSYDCDLTGDILLKAANEQSSVHTKSWLYLLAVAVSALLLTTRWPWTFS